MVSGGFFIFIYFWGKEIDFFFSLWGILDIIYGFWEEGRGDSLERCYYVDFFIVLKNIFVRCLGFFVIRIFVKNNLFISFIIISVLKFLVVVRFLCWYLVMCVYVGVGVVGG